MTAKPTLKRMAVAASLGVALVGLVLAASAQVQQPPVYRGATNAEGVIGTDGGVLILTRVPGQPMLVIPANLTDHSYSYSFSVEQQVEPAEVHEGFSPIGPTLRFSHALNASESPIEVSLRARPPAPGTRHVLAVERTELCSVDGEGTLCSEWYVIGTTHYDGRVRARLPVTEGWRMQFGTLTPTVPGSS